MTHQVSAIVHSMAPKLEDPSAFTIPCTTGSADFAKALCDLGASINLMPYSVFKTLGIGQPRPTSIRLQMEDRTMKRLLGIIDDVLVRVDKFILPADFVILDCEVDYEVPIILGRPLLAMGKTLVDVEADDLTFRVGDEKVVFHVCKYIRQPNSNEVCSFVDLVTEVIIDDARAMMNVDDTLEAVLLNHDDDEKDGYVKCVDSPLAVLQKRKKAIGWTLADIRGISPVFCMHKIILEKDAKPSVDHQRGLNEAMQEVVKKDIIKWLDTKGVRSFLGHVRFYRRFIKEFSKAVNPLCKLLEKDAKFHFNKDCMKAFELIKFKLTTNPIITTPDWSLPFELMYDASDAVVGAVLGNISTKSSIRSTMLFRPNLMGTKVIIHTDHAALRYLMSNKDSKARLMWWVLLLQEFDLEIQDRKGSENQVADHLSRLEEEGRPHDGLEINDSFLDEKLLSISMTKMPWFADLANYLVSGICGLSVFSL
ncbi:uncharacterized protein [Nicotiana tomentosiformis]|uniref:uncharacterized protein n=1 Tax=Nicotiana tomentosiformis TaxID=4098 RepID=UPI00388C4A84